MSAVEVLPPSEAVHGNDRLWSKVDATGDCWEWTAYRTQLGYGYVKHSGTPRPAHLVVYEALVGPVPEGLELDHLCRNTGCVNPDHLEPVTHAENIRRGGWGTGTGARLQAAKTHCPKGHAYTPENVRIDHRGSRLCRECGRDSNRRWRARTALVA